MSCPFPSFPALTTCPRASAQGEKKASDISHELPSITPSLRHINFNLIFLALALRSLGFVMIQYGWMDG